MLFAIVTSSNVVVTARVSKLIHRFFCRNYANWSDELSGYDDDDKTVKCLDGWDYEDKIYHSSIVTEVRSHNCSVLDKSLIHTMPIKLSQPHQHVNQTLNIIA